MPLQRLHWLIVCLLLAPSLAWAQAGDDDILNDLGPAPGAEAKPTEAAAEPPPTEADVAPAPKAEAAEPAEADPDEEAKAQAQAAPASLDRIKAVPRKVMLKRGRVELSPFFALSMNDSYFQHLAVSGQVIFYPHDAFGIGIGADYLYAHVRSDNVDTVRQTQTSVPAVFELPWMFTHLDAYWVPIYGKLSLFDSQIIHFDFYLSAGGGVALAGGRTPPLASFAIGQRFILGDFVALRVELRDHMFLDTQEVNEQRRSDVQNYVMLQVGASFFVPPSFEYGAP